MVVDPRRGAPDSAGTTLPSAGGLLRDPSCSQLNPSRTLPNGLPGVAAARGMGPDKVWQPMGELLPRSQILCAVSGCRTKKNMST